MSRKQVLMLLLILLAVSLAGAKGRDDFLGVWALKDGSNDITIIKEGERYFIIEFVHIKHELFFSGDGSHALFMEWGKGPGWDTTMLQLDGDTIADMYFSEKYIWEPSPYIYYRMP
jgi:hypothetical protein